MRRSLHPTYSVVAMALIIKRYTERKVTNHLKKIN